MRDTEPGADPATLRRRLRYRMGAVTCLLALAAGAAWLATAQVGCTGGAGGLVIHDARGQPRVTIGLTGGCQALPR